MYLGSYWDHTALILYPKRPEKGRLNDILVESIRHGLLSFIATRGVAVHRLERYLAHPERYEIGIKRVPNLTDEQVIRITHFMLMNVDAPYWPWRRLQILASVFIPGARWFLSFRQRFSCSGIIQQAYYDTMDWHDKERVVFTEHPKSPIELLELVSPADIATTPNADWIYNRH